MTTHHGHRFQSGDRVTVLDLGKSGHVRIPFYVRGQAGEVVSYCGTYLNPEELAVGLTSGPAIDLYRVAFRQQDLWPSDDTHTQHDRLVIEIYDHWLAPQT
ncbi:MAG: SH3-like domain-containing protein [Alphaproteobacteria bacterium]